MGSIIKMPPTGRRARISSIQQTTRPTWKRRVRLLLEPRLRKILAFTLLLVVIVSLAVRGYVERRSEDSATTRAELIELLGPFRPMRGRLTGFSYAPPGHKTRASSADIQQLAQRIQKMLGQRKTADELATLSLVDLARGDLPRASAALKHASRMSPVTAAVYIDLAAISLERAFDENNASLLMEAFSVSVQALSSAPASREALFNFGLVQEQLGLFRQSTGTWETYLGLDPDSPWTGEAKSYLRRRQAADAREAWERSKESLLTVAGNKDVRGVDKIVRSFPQPTRRYLREEILLEWAGEVKRGDGERADRLAGMALLISSRLAEYSKDTLLSEHLDILQQGYAVDILSLAHQENARAIDLCRTGEPEKGNDSFSDAEARFTSVGSPFRYWVRFEQAKCNYSSAQAGRALGLLEDLEADVLQVTYPDLLGWIRWLLGLIHLERAEPSQALDYFQRALADFESVGEIENQGSVASLIANSLDYMGRQNEAWNYRWRALRSIGAATEPERSRIVYGGAAKAAARDGIPQLALAFQGETFDFILASGDPLGIAEEYWWRAMMLSQSGKSAEALQAISMARDNCDGIRDEGSRLRTLAGIAVTEGSILRRLNPRRAINALGFAIESYRQAEYRYLLVDIYLERARSFLALSDPDSAEADLLLGIEEYERGRSLTGDSVYRIGYFQRSGDIFSEMVGFQVKKRQNPEKGLAFLERAKARELSDSLVGGLLSHRSQQSSISEIIARLPARVVLLEYLVREDATIAWALSRGHMKCRILNIGRAEVERLHRKLLVSMDGGDLEAASLLYSSLVRPFAEEIARASHLVFVIDGALEGLPFSALFDSDSSRFLVESHSTSVASSASTFMLAFDQVSSLPRLKGPRALAIGNPTFDRRSHPSLADLPKAADEAEYVASLMPGSLALTGARATLSRFFSMVDEFDLIHFSGHGVVDHSNAHNSYLLFAASRDGRRGRLLMKDALPRLRRPRLVVLSACATATGSRDVWEGAQNLARPFLAAGSPAVIASLWNVDDEQAHYFFERFYKCYASGVGPSEALQATQIWMLRKGGSRLSSPKAWSGFELIGASGTDGSIGHGETLCGH